MDIVDNKRQADAGRDKAPGEVSLGTSIIAATFQNGVILGADSRTTTGSYIANRVSDKLTPLSPRIYCCRSGSAADTQALADAAAYQLGLLAVTMNQPMPPVQWAARLLQSMCYQNKDQLMAGLIIAGIDGSGVGQVWSVPLGGSLHRQPFAIGGSGSSYIYGWCDAHWRDNMDEAEATEFVKTALSLAMSRDGSSGGVIRMAVITKESVDRKMVPPSQQPVFWQG